MTEPVAEAYKRYCERNPEQPVSHSYFHKLRPKNVLLCSKTPTEFCCCVYCDNIDFYIEAMKDLLLIRYEKRSHVIKSLICDRNNYNCSTGKCLVCVESRPLLLKLLKSDYKTSSVFHMKWITGHKCSERIDEYKLGEIVVEEFLQDFVKFKRHQYIAFTQKYEMDGARLILSENRLMCISDFSQNMTSMVQRQTQSNFFNMKQIS